MIRLIPIIAFVIFIIAYIVFASIYFQNLEDEHLKDYREHLKRLTEDERNN